MTTIARQVLQVMLALLPVAVGLILVRLLPAPTLALDAPTSGPWRLDPLALIGCCILSIAAAHPRPLLLGSRIAVAVAGLMVALVISSPILQTLAVVLVSLLVVDALGPRWFIALACFALVTFAPHVSMTWLPTSLPLWAALVMAFVGGGAVSWFGRRDLGEAEIALRPFWLLVLLRTLTLEPWPVLAMVVVTALSTLALAGIAVSVLRGAPVNGRERTLAALLMMALVAMAQNTILGVAAALWALAMYAVLAVVGPLKGFAPLPLVGITFGVAGWWTVGAVAAAGGFLGAAVVCLVCIAVCIAALFGTADESSSRMPAIGRFALLVGVVVGLPWATTTFTLPVAQQLGAGLTAPGLLDAWSFIGLSAMDAGHRRVTLLPSTVIGCVFIVVWAAIWLLGRLRGFAPVQSVGRSDEAVQHSLRSRVWWLR